MKRLTPALVVAFMVATFPPVIRAEVETYASDPVRSSIRFSIRHFFTQASGHFGKFDAILRFDRDNPGQSTAEAVIAVASVDTENAERDAHLRKPEFFDAGRFPDIAFRSRTWRKTAENEFDVTGDLTIKGVTKAVSLKVRAPGSGRGGQPDRALPVWKATAKVNRHDFGVSAFGKVLGADVEVVISLGVVKKS